MMKIDFHIHVKLSKKVSFSPEYFQAMISEARQEGLQAITMTEHFNTLRFNDIYDELDRSYPYRNHYYDVDGFKVFPGMEVDVAEGGHILVIGTRESIRSIHAKLTGHMTDDSFIPFDRLMTMCSEHEMLIIGAHPFRSSNSLQRLSQQQLSQLDAVDLNAKDLRTYGVEAMHSQMREYAAQAALPLVGGSDTHHPLQVGSIVNTLGRTCDTIADLKRCIKEGDYSVAISPCLPIKVRAADDIKQLLQADLLRQSV
ncbi:histidinol-phosphatase [compost metagenome]